MTSTRKLLAALMAASALLAPAHAAGPGSNVPPGIVSGNTSVPSYSAAFHNLSASFAGDLMCISGSATKTIEVKVVRASAIASAAVVSSVSVIRRSTLNTGGTPVAGTIVPNDPLDDAGTATVTAWSAAPTLGNAVGTVRAVKMAIPTVSTTGFSNLPATFDFASWWDQPIVLRKTTDALCLDVDATAGGVWEIDLEWTEKP